MNRKEIIKYFDEYEVGDTEMTHVEADTAILKFLEAEGYMDVVAAYERLIDREGGFWFA